MGLGAQRELEQELQASAELSLLPAPRRFALAGQTLGSWQPRRQRLLQSQAASERKFLRVFS